MREVSPGEAEVRNRVNAIVSELSPCLEVEINGKSTLTAELGYDSLVLWELLAELEQGFGVTIDLEEGAVETVADVQALVLAALGGGKGVSDAPGSTAR